MMMMNDDLRSEMGAATFFEDEGAFTLHPEPQTLNNDDDAGDNGERHANHRHRRPSPPGVQLLADVAGLGPGVPRRRADPVPGLGHPLSDLARCAIDR